MVDGGILNPCHVSAEHLARAMDTNEKVTTMHKMLTTLLQDTAHLSKLDCLERIEDRLIAPAVSENKIDKSFTILIVKIMGACIFLLTACVVFLLTGEHFGIIGALHR